MPIIQVETNVPCPVLERRFAKAVSRWLHRRDVPLGHVVVKFTRISTESVYVGPYPIASKQRDEAWAFVTAYISHERDRAFRSELARLVVETLQPDVAARHVLVSVRPVSSQDFFVGSEIEGQEDGR